MKARELQDSDWLEIFCKALAGSVAFSSQKFSVESWGNTKAWIIKISHYYRDDNEKNKAVSVGGQNLS